MLRTVEKGPSFPYGKLDPWHLHAVLVDSDQLTVSVTSSTKKSLINDGSVVPWKYTLTA